MTDSLEHVFTFRNAMVWDQFLYQFIESVFLEEFWDIESNVNVQEDGLYIQNLV
jgi:hypothetical protein